MKLSSMETLRLTADIEIQRRDSSSTYASNIPSNDKLVIPASEEGNNPAEPWIAL